MVNPVSWTLKKVKSINDAIWHTPLSEQSARKSILIRQMRIIVLAARGFSNDKVQIRASALTFYSLLSVIPLLAIGLGIAKGFGLDQNLEQVIIRQFQSQQELLDSILRMARNAIDATNGGYIAGVGIVVLFWSVMSLLNHIESSFNHIWQIRVSRAWYRKFTDYLTIMLIVPVFIILSSSVTVFIKTELVDFLAQSGIPEFLKGTVSFLVRFLPYFLAWFVLAAMYIIMPNTKVKFGSAFVAGIVSGTILQLLQWFYIDLQFGIAKLSTIYGTLAAIPLLILWLQTSWLIVLLGAELSFANQNVSRYEFESEALNISNFQKRALTLLIMSRIIKTFARGDQARNAEQIARDLKIPVRLVRDIVQDLDAVGLISMVQKSDDKERLYQPAMDINHLTVSYVLGRIDRKGVEHEIIMKSKDYNKVNEILLKFDKMVGKSDLNILIKDL